MPSSSFTHANSATHLRVDGISMSFADRRVLTDVSFIVSAGELTGLIGENGSGKSTILRIIAGLTTPDAGAVRATALGGYTPRIGLLHQQPPFHPSSSITEAVESAVAQLRAAATAVDAAAGALAVAPDDETAARVYAETLDTARN